MQWLGLHVFTAKGVGSIPGQELRSHKLHGRAKKNKTRICLKKNPGEKMA